MNKVVLCFALSFIWHFSLSQGPIPHPMPCIIVNNPTLSNYPQGGIWASECIYSGIADYNVDTDYSLRAGNYISFNPGTVVNPNSSSQFHAYIESSQLELAWFYPQSTVGQVGLYEKLEIGAKMPVEIQDKINAFISDTPGDKINPFMEWEIQVEATFVNTNTGTVKKCDAFYYEEFERNVVPYTGPIPVSDAVYPSVGGSWTNLQTPFKFRVRFAPPEEGTWIGHITVHTPLHPSIPAIESGQFFFDVYDTGNPGFVEVGDNSIFLKRGNETFLPVGPNFGHPFTYNSLNPTTKDIYQFNQAEIGRPDPCPLQSFLDYEENLIKLADAGANHFRFFLAPYATDIEFEEIGNYYDRLNRAWEVDSIIGTAKKHGLFIHFDMLIHYGLTTNEFGIKWWDWASQTEYQNYSNIDPFPSPGAPADSGYCYRQNQYFQLDHPNEFLTDSLAKKFYKQKLRYIVSRWGYATNIEFFELMSEIPNLGSVYSDFHDDDNDTTTAEKRIKLVEPPYLNDGVVQQAVHDWHDEMSTYIKQELASNHLVTISYSHSIRGNDESYDLPNIDLISKNNYNDFVSGDFDGGENPSWWYKISKNNFYNSELTRHGYIDFLRNKSVGKPVIFPENGSKSTGECAPGLEVTRNIWMSLFSGVAVCNDWDVWSRSAYWENFGYVRNFFDGHELDQDNWQSGASIPFGNSAWNKMESNDKNVDMLYLVKGDQTEVIGILNNRTYNPWSIHSTCGEEPNWYKDPNNSDWASPISIGNTGSDFDGLKIKNLLPGVQYEIEYFDTQGNSLNLFTYDNGPNVKVKHPSLEFLMPFKLRVSNTKNSIEEFEDPNFTTTNETALTVRVYPNPTFGDLFISTPQPMRLSIYKETGAEIILDFTLNPGVNLIDMSKYESGFYYIELVDIENNIIRKKVCLL